MRNNKLVYHEFKTTTMTRYMRGTGSVTVGDRGNVERLLSDFKYEYLFYECSYECEYKRI